VIEPTSEMRLAFDEAPGADKDCVCPICLNHRLAAVLAIVEHEVGLIGPCSAMLPHLVNPETAEFCELRHGHTGDHESGPTRWRERS